MERREKSDPQEKLRARIQLAGSLAGNTPEVVADMINTTPQEAQIFMNHAKQDARGHLTRTLWQGNNLTQIRQVLNISKESVTQIGKELGLSTKGSTPSPEVVTRRQQVAELWNQGKTGKEIANELGVSIYTAKNAVAFLRKKNPELVLKKNKTGAESETLKQQIIELWNQEKTYAEIASLLETSLANIKMHLHRMRKKGVNLERRRQ